MLAACLAPLIQDVSALTRFTRILVREHIFSIIMNNKRKSKSMKMLNQFYIVYNIIIVVTNSV